MNDYEVEIYGHAGAGKTILLASLYNALSNMRESGKEEISNLYQSAELADKTRDLIAFNKFPGPTEKTDNPVQFLTFRLTVKGKPINLRISAHAGEEHRDKETKAIREEVADKSKKLLVVVVNPFLHNADLAWKAFRNLIAVLLQDEQLLSFQEACYAASYILFQVTEESLDDNYLKHVGVEATFQPLEGVRLKYDHHEPDIEKRFTLDNASDEATQSLEKLKELVTRIVQGEQGDRDRLINLVKGLENSMVVLSHIDLVDLLPCIEQADFDYVCNVLFNWEPNRSYRQQLLAHNIRLKIGSHHKEDIFPVQVLINSAQQFYRNVRSFAIEAKFKPLPDRATDGKFKPLPDRAILKWPVIFFMVVAVLLVTGIGLYRLSVPTIPVEHEPKKIGIEERIIAHPYDEVTRLAIRTAIWQMIVHNENKDNQRLRIALFLDLVSQEKKRQLQLLADEYLAAEKDMMAFTRSLAELVDTYQSFDEAKVGKTSFFTFVNSLADDLLNEENSAKSLKGIDKDVDKSLKDLDTFSNSQKDAKSAVENAKSKLAEAKKLPAKNAQRAEKVNNAKKELENANKSLSVFDKTLTSKEENVRIALWKVVSQSLPEKDILKAVAEASEENEPQKLLRSYIDDVLLTQLKLDKLNKTELQEELGRFFEKFAFAPELGSYPPYGVKKLEAWLADKNTAESMSRLIDSELETLIDKDWNKVLGYLSDTIDLNSMEKEKQEILKRSIILQWIMAFNVDERRQLYLAMVW